MKIALLGYGRMGKEIERIALERNHTINLIIDKENTEDFNKENLQKVDVCIDFSNPDSAYNNIKECILANTPIISGTTGWIDKLEEAKTFCSKNNGAFFYASNYSLGVNVFFKMNEWLAKVMNKFEDYSVQASETHHIHKIDAPSGTAISLLDGIIKHHDKFESWTMEEDKKDKEIPVQAHRIPDVPGTHEIMYDSNIDSIEIKHRAKNRIGFALGAVIAAEFMIDKTGYYTMNELLKLD